MPVNNSQQGQSLIEILFAMAIFIVGVVTIGYLVIESGTSLYYSNDLIQARLLATEGIEAAISIRDENFALLTEGEHGLIILDGVWQLSSSSDEFGKYNRTITIADIDRDNKNITAAVQWTMFGGREKSVSYTTRVTDWHQTQGEAGSLEVYTDSVMTNASGTVLYGLAFKNIGDENVVIDTLTFDWDSLVSLSGLTIDGTELASSTFASGAEIDVADIVLESQSGIHSVDSITFDGNIENTNVLLSIRFRDGSVRSMYVNP